MEEKYITPSLDMVRRTFTDSENAEEADLVVRLIQEIRSMESYIPELELIMVKELVGGALDRISGIVSYTDYQALR